MKHLALAIREAQQSEYKCRMAAILFKGNKVVSRGHNWANRYTSRIEDRYKKWPTSVHAEIDALLRASCDPKGLDLLVIRLGKADNLLLARPCQFCLTYLQHMGIRNIYYSNSDGQIVKL